MFGEGLNARLQTRRNGPIVRPNVDWRFYGQIADFARPDNEWPRGAADIQGFWRRILSAPRLAFAAIEHISRRAACVPISRSSSWQSVKHIFHHGQATLPISPDRTARNDLQARRISPPRDTRAGIQIMSEFDFGLEAELFPPRNRKFAGRQFRYRRFETAADAIRFAVEVLPPDVLSGTIIEAGEARCDSKEIRRLYDSADYPLPRNGSACTAAA
jgi:hypothetical protein